MVSSLVLAVVALAYQHQRMSYLSKTKFRVIIIQLIEMIVYLFSFLILPS